MLFRSFYFKLESSEYNIDIDYNEVQEIIRLPADVVFNNFELKQQVFTFSNGQKYDLPCLKLDDNNVIWGLTLMVLRELNQLHRRKNS